MVLNVAILLTSMQCGEGFLMPLKNFDYWCSVVFKTANNVKKFNTSRGRNEH